MHSLHGKSQGITAEANNLQPVFEYQKSDDHASKK